MPCPVWPRLVSYTPGEWRQSLKLNRAALASVSPYKLAMCLVSEKHKVIYGNDQERKQREYGSIMPHMNEGLD
jgi:hypothetical protein